MAAISDRRDSMTLDELLEECELTHPHEHTRLTAKYFEAVEHIEMGGSEDEEDLAEDFDDLRDALTSLLKV